MRNVCCRLRWLENWSPHKFLWQVRYKERERERRGHSKKRMKRTETISSSVVCELPLIFTSFKTITSREKLTFSPAVVLLIEFRLALLCFIYLFFSSFFLFVSLLHQNVTVYSIHCYSNLKI